MENSVTHVGFTAIPTTSISLVPETARAAALSLPEKLRTKYDLRSHHRTRMVSRYETRVITPPRLYFVSCHCGFANLPLLCE